MLEAYDPGETKNLSHKPIAPFKATEIKQASRLFGLQLELCVPELKNKVSRVSRQYRGGKYTLPALCVLWTKSFQVVVENSVS